jgi:hypothetical protein
MSVEQIVVDEVYGDGKVEVTEENVVWIPVYCSWCFHSVTVLMLMLLFFAAFGTGAIFNLSTSLTSLVGSRNQSTIVLVHSMWQAIFEVRRKGTVERGRQKVADG